MNNNELITEARQDIKDIKDTLNSMDKNLSLSVLEMTSLKEKTQELDEKVYQHDKHINFEKTSIKLIAIVGTILIAVSQLIPLIEKFKSLF